VAPTCGPLQTRSRGNSALVLHSAAAAVEAADVPLHLRWQPRPWLLSVALLVLVPAIALWVSAISDSLGITHVLASLPLAVTATSRPERLLLLGTFLTVMLVFPLLAVLLGDGRAPGGRLHLRH
jgi:hypothetical protein